MENKGLTVSNKTNPNSLGGAIAEIIKCERKTEIRVIGAGALNQAIKGVIVARGFVASLGINLVCIPAFMNTSVEDDIRTGIKLIIREEK